jgi:PadR family transcriptional regulator PadR
MTPQLQRVLRTFLDDPAAARYGYDLMKAVGLKSGTLYPLLARLEEEHLVTSAWETPRQAGERPRKYYWMTGEGVRVARLELATASAAIQRSRAVVARRHRSARNDGRSLASQLGRLYARLRVGSPACQDAGRAPTEVDGPSCPPSSTTLR